MAGVILVVCVSAMLALSLWILFCSGTKRMTDQPSITCPECGMTSYNPNDIREGYCGNCHAYTSAR